MLNEWKLEEDSINSESKFETENEFCLRNEVLEQSAYFEEDFSGKQSSSTFFLGEENKGTEDKLKIPDFVGLHVMVKDELLDLNEWKITSFKRTLDLNTGLLQRSFRAISPIGYEVSVEAERFLSMDNPELAAISYAIRPENFSGDIILCSYINAAESVKPAWEVLHTENKKDAFLLAKAKESNMQVCLSMSNSIYVNGSPKSISPDLQQNDVKVQTSFTNKTQKGEAFYIEKYIGICKADGSTEDALVEKAVLLAKNAAGKGYKALKIEHVKAMGNK